MIGLFRTKIKRLQFKKNNKKYFLEIFQKIPSKWVLHQANFHERVEQKLEVEPKMMFVVLCKLLIRYENKTRQNTRWLSNWRIFWIIGS